MASSEVLEQKGIGGSVQLDREALTFTHTGVYKVAKGAGTVRVPLRAIDRVDFVEPHRWNEGELRVHLAGDADERPSASSDRYSLAFGVRQQDGMHQLVTALRERLQGVTPTPDEDLLRATRPPMPPPAPVRGLTGSGAHRAPQPGMPPLVVPQPQAASQDKFYRRLLLAMDLELTFLSCQLILYLGGILVAVGVVIWFFLAVR